MNYHALSVKFGLNAYQLAAFLGQLHHESGGFRRKYENLNYSAKRLLEIFPRYFTPITAGYAANKPELIANTVYADKNRSITGKLGNIYDGDGWKFRGRGFIQLTGRNNYTAFSRYIGEDVVANPDLVAEKYPFEAAFWYFKNKKIFALCENDISISTITKVTKLVNGGTIGLADRIAKTNYHYSEIKKKIK